MQGENQATHCVNSLSWLGFDTTQSECNRNAQPASGHTASHPDHALHRVTGSSLSVVGLLAVRGVNDINILILMRFPPHITCKKIGFLVSVDLCSLKSMHCTSSYTLRNSLIEKVCISLFRRYMQVDCIDEYLESTLLVEQGAQGISQLRALLSQQAASYPGVGSTQDLVVGVS